MRGGPAIAHPSVSGVLALAGALRTRHLALVIALLPLRPLPAAAQFEGPRAYWKAAVDTHSPALWYVRVSQVYNRNASSVTNVGLATYNGYFGLFDRSAIIVAMLPVGRLDFELTGGPEEIEGTSRGLGDLYAILDVNLIGAPAMSVAEFARWRNGTVIDVSVALTAPTGDYDPMRPINLGSNRWGFRFGFPLTQGIGTWEVGKRTTLEVYPYLWVFTDNDDVLDGSTEERAPLVQFETHLTRDLTRQLWASLDYLYLGGGATKLDGERTSHSVDAHYAGGTLGYLFTSNLELFAIYGGVFRSGGIDFDRFRIQFQWYIYPQTP